MIPSSFLQGLVAGYGIAIPVGAIAILIVETGLRRGFVLGFFAGAGAASADLIYAGLAALAGSQLVALLKPAAQSMQLLSGLLLILLGINGMVRSWKHTRRESSPGLGAGMARPLRIFARFLLLTLLNPLTVAYFTALIVGGAALGIESSQDRLWFVLGAGAASLSWQTLLAGVGAWSSRLLTQRARFWLSLAGNMLVTLLGLRVLLSPG